MPILLILVLVVHSAAAIGWMVVTWVIGRRSVEAGRRLFPVQMIAGLLTIAAGGRLWTQLHAGGTGLIEQILGFGAVLGVLALLGQVLLRGKWQVKVNRITVWMLAASLVAMEFGKQLKGL